MTLDSRPRAAILLLAGAALALGGCGGVQLSGWDVFGKSPDVWKVEPNKYPMDYKNDLLKFMRTELTDPTNIRSAFITDPTLKPFGNESRYAVCVRYNARGIDGQYQGSKESIAVFYGAQINQFRDATSEECGAVVYRPFPELEALRRLDAR
jgi:hypothetical protein